MSIAIQKEMIQRIDHTIAENSKLSWTEFVDKVAGANEHMLLYLPLLKSIPAMDNPFELMIQFNTLRGQFASSEQKMCNLLVENEFIEDQDYCLLDVDNEKFTETLMFISYNCIKLFVMDNQDTRMTHALILGEQMYDKYKSYSKSFLKALSPKTHYMMIEQKSFDVENATAKCVKAFGNPKVIIVSITGTLPNMVKKIAEFQKNPKCWGEVIIPLTKAMFSSALDDTARIADYVTETLVKPYKSETRIQLKTRKVATPTNSVAWGCVVRSTHMIVSPTHPSISFTHADFVQCVKECFVKTLAQKHISIKNFSSDEYLDCVKDLEEERIKNTGRYSAIKANSIYFKQLCHSKRVIKHAESIAKKNLNGVFKRIIPTTMVTASNGYETNGSADEMGKPEAPKKSAKKVTIDKPEAPKKAPKKSAKKVTIDEPEAPKKSAKKVTIDEPEVPKKSAKKVTIDEPEVLKKSAKKVTIDEPEVKPKRRTPGSKVEISQDMLQVETKPLKRISKVVEQMPDSDSDVDVPTVVEQMSDSDSDVDETPNDEDVSSDVSDDDGDDEDVSSDVSDDDGDDTEG
jgi:hypothetical protein